MMHNLVIFVFIALCLSEPLISFTLKQQNFHFSSSLRARPITTDTIRTSTAQYPSLSFSPPLLSTPLLQKYKKDPFVPLNTLIIDNYDSYTFNIWQYLAEINKRAPTVIYNNNWDYLKWLEETNYAEFDSIILSPGPGSVINHEDFGICRDVILRTPLPLLGVCLGHQGIAHVFGGHVGKAPEPVHGRIWNVDHRGTGLFRGVAPHTPVTRYHSLAVYNEASHPLPSCLEVTAKTAEGVIMALKHKTRPLYGVQFHPESIGTNEGKKILSNFMNIASQMRRHIPSDQDHMPTVTHDTRQSYITPSSLVHTSSKTPVKESSSSISIENKKKGVRNVFVTSRSFSSLVKPVSVSGNSIHNNEDDLIEQLFSTLFSKSNASFWLDNPSYRQQTISPTSSMVSYLGSADSEGGCVLEYEGGERLQQRLSDGTTSQLNQTIFEYIHEGIEEQKNEWDIIAHMIDPSSDIPVDVLNSAVADVAKGRVLFGYLGYEARHEAVALLTQTSASHTPTSHVTNKHHTENSNTDSEISAPKSVFFLPARYIAVDHARQILHVISLQDEVSKDKVAKHEDSKNSSNIHSTFVEKVDQVLNSFSQRSSTAPHSVCATLQPVPESIQGTLYSTFSKQQYSDKIRQCLEHISDGESYELCLTMKFLGKRSTLSSDTGSSVNDDGMDFSTYKRLRRRNPAPYSSFIKYKSMNANAVGKSYDFSVGCSSPERYLKLTKEGVIESKPIKGTAKRDLTDLVRDQQIVSTLAQNEKCRAENLMIVDLVRNDLGRVCEVGSVITSKLMEVETYTSVHQMVSTIRGQLCANMNVADALVATFPGGSMTGAPKLRTMELIDQLEEHQPRGIYSGTIGYIALDGSADLNIVIRTAIISGDQITVGAGGAIVAQSDPEMEVDEVLTKARSVSAAIGFNLAFSPDL